MAKTGIHIKRANIGSVEAHNLRTKEYLDGLKKAGRSIYFFEEESHKNQSWENPKYQGKSCKQIQDELLELYRQKVGQTPQLKDRIRVNKKTGKEYTVAGWSPIREGVVPIKDSTTLEDFQLVKQWAESKGLDIIRIDIHQDEGYRNEETGATKHNRHAHIVFDWVDRNTGKTLKLDNKDMSEFQDIVAESLQMERGVPKAISGINHIDHAEYRQRMAEQELASIEQKMADRGNDIKNINKQLETAKKGLKEALKNKDVSISKLEEEIRELDDNKDSLLEEIETLKKREKELMKDGWNALGWVAKKLIGVKDEKQQQALEEINKWRDEAIAEVNERELKATEEIHKLKEQALEEMREETERNLLAEWKLKNTNIHESSKDEELGKTLIGLSSVNEGWKMIVEITKSALEWGIRGFQEIKNLINGQIVTLPRQKVVQGEVLGEEVNVRAVRCEDGIHRVANFIEDKWRFIDDFMKDLLERKARKTREEMEERAQEIKKKEMEKPAAPQKPAPRFTPKYYEGKPSEIQQRTPKKINVPKKSEGKKRGRSL